MNETLYSIKLTLLICMGYGLTLAFMLGLQKMLKLIGHTNEIAIEMLVIIIINEIISWRKHGKKS